MTVKTPDILVIVGDKDSGKTALAARESDVPGTLSFLSPKVFEKGEFIGYDLKIEPLFGTFPLARFSGGFNEDAVETAEEWKFKRFLFSRGAFGKAGEITKTCLFDYRRLVVDEIGPLEMAEKGFFQQLLFVSGSGWLKNGNTLICTVRPALRNDIARLMVELFHCPVRVMPL